MLTGCPCLQQQPAQQRNLSGPCRVGSPVNYPAMITYTAIGFPESQSQCTCHTQRSTTPAALLTRRKTPRCFSSGGWYTGAPLGSGWASTKRCRRYCTGTTVRSLSQGPLEQRPCSCKTPTPTKHPLLFLARMWQQLGLSDTLQQNWTKRTD